jgi:uncharacterized protein with NRDE domain
VSSQFEDYAGFNLLIGDAAGVFYLGNRPRAAEPVEPGVHGLSNHLLNSEWPKVRTGREGLTALIRADEDELVGGLFELLADRRRAPDAELPSTGVSLDWERALSARFIVTEGYGTRASTVALIRADGSLRFEERAFGPQAVEISRVAFETDLKAPA